MDVYARVAKNVEPKKQKLAEAEKQVGSSWAGCPMDGLVLVELLL